MFAAFLPKEQLMAIFGGNLLNDTSLLPTYRELLGLEGHKPFECVGTPDESKAAFLLAHRRGDLNDTIAMRMFVNDALHSISDPDRLVTNVLTASSEHTIPKEFLSVLQPSQP